MTKLLDIWFAKYIIWVAYTMYWLKELLIPNKCLDECYPYSGIDERTIYSILNKFLRDNIWLMWYFILSGMHYLLIEKILLVVLNKCFVCVLSELLSRFRNNFKKVFKIAYIHWLVRYSIFRGILYLFVEKSCCWY